MIRPAFVLQFFSPVANKEPAHCLWVTSAVVVLGWAVPAMAAAPDAPSALAQGPGKVVNG